MKIVLDCVVPDKDRFVAYVQLRDENENIIATQAIYYQAGETETLKQAAVAKFKDTAIEQMNKQAQLAGVQAELEAALATIDVAKEISAPKEG
jgi:hypothetical protein